MTKVAVLNTPERCTETQLTSWLREAGLKYSTYSYFSSTGVYVFTAEDPPEGPITQSALNAIARDFATKAMNVGMTDEEVSQFVALDAARVEALLDDLYHAPRPVIFDPSKWPKKGDPLYEEFAATLAAAAANEIKRPDYSYLRR